MKKMKVNDKEHLKELISKGVNKFVSMINGAIDREFYIESKVKNGVTYYQIHDKTMKRVLEWNTGDFLFSGGKTKICIALNNHVLYCVE